MSAPRPAVFFRTEAGNEPVRDWLKAMSKEDRKLIGTDIKTVQFRWPLGMPLVSSIGGGLWEKRSKRPTLNAQRSTLNEEEGGGQRSGA